MRNDNTVFVSNKCTQNNYIVVLYTKPKQKILDNTTNLFLPFSKNFKVDSRIVLQIL